MSRSIWKRYHCFRQYFGPVHTFPLLFENEYFLLLFDLVCFVLFSPIWPIDDNSVSGDNSYRKCILSKCFPKWRFLNTFASRLRAVDGRKREVFEYHDVINHMPRVAIVFPSFSNCEDGRKRWKRYVWKRIFQRAEIKFPFPKISGYVWTSFCL